ncbi:MAG: DUF4968 domain-containing protein [Streptococcaceae bacterium]|jgi:alpha-glucosidase|nr:DUF4968 domain-containing protein [Streptococcaceae bacterium]
MKTSNKLISVEEIDNYLLVKTEEAQFQVYFLDENIIRLRGTFKEEFERESSYALVKTAWKDQLDDFFKNERKTVEGLPFELLKTEKGYSARADKYSLEINADPFFFKILDENGNILHQDVPERSFLQNDLGQSYHYSVIEDESKFYGFGEKSGLLNKYRRHMRMHNTDSLGWDAELSDPLYKMIPFYINFNSKKNLAHGLFYNNAYDSAFDIDCEHSNYWPKYSFFEADGGDLDLFFIGGPTIKEVVEHYTDLTGKSVMQPLASFGYMGSTMFYTELDQDSDQAILDFVDTCKENEIPIDGFFLSSGYTSKEDGKRYVFNWNYKRFPDPGKFVEDLKERGVLLAPNIKPAMLVSHPLTEEFESHNAYIKTPDLQNFQKDRYWGGKAHFVDFTGASGREIWEKKMNEQLLSLGITNIWNDNNEYEISENQAIAEAEGLKKPIAALKPIMSMMMAKTAQEAILKHSGNVRPYLTNRAGFAGIQRYAQTWAGDNWTSWKSLKYNVPTILGMGLSGVANQGCDIGGFDGPAPEPELFVRWVQNGIFQPRFSIHSCNTDNTVTEPWMYPSYTKFIREAIKLRYRLAPYFYSLLYEASIKGSPIMRPLVYEFQNDLQVAEESFEFMLGPSLLVANVLEKNQTLKKVYLPKGSDWYNLVTFEAFRGGQTIEIPVNLSSIPMFLRSGSVLVEAPELMNLHKDSISLLQLTIEPSVDSEFTLYEDDGESLNYKNGESLLTKIRTKPAVADTEIQFEKNGSYQTKLQDLRVNVLCPKISPLSIKLEGRELTRFLRTSKFEEAQEGWFYDGEKQQVSIKLKNPEENQFKIRIESGQKDLISI